MAVLRRQAVFVQSLYQSGAVDEGERDAILAEVGRRERQLEITGAYKGARKLSAGGAVEAACHDIH